MQTNPPNDAAPRGRDEVRQAIMDATAKLLLKRSPTKISVREIAEAARVKHPLIYRHFGSKNQLIREVHSRYVNMSKNEISDIDRLQGNLKRFFDSFEKNRWRQITIARAVFDGVDPREIQNRFPVMEKLIELIRKDHGEADIDPEIVAAALASMAIGWIMFKPFITVSTKLDGRDEKVLNDEMVRMLEEFLSRITDQNR